jgi:NADPH2:quinone reductase
VRGVKAIHATESSAGNRLVTVDLSEPEGSDLVVIAVEAAGVAQPDILQISGLYQTGRPFPFVPGTEAVGTVIATGDKDRDLIGRRVVAITPDGAWQERVAVPVSEVFVVPDDISADQAALLLVNYVAAYFGLVRRASAQAGETLLVHGAAGGIGGAAVQVGAALGLRTIAVTSTPEKAAYARALRATDVVDVDDWKSGVEALVGRSGVDLIFDPVAGDRFDDSLRVLTQGGRLLIIGFLGGDIPQVKINKLLLRNISLVGVATGAYMQQHPVELTNIWAQLCSLITDGSLSLPSSTSFPMEHAEDAVALVRERRAVGKVVLSVPAAWGSDDVSGVRA